MTICDSQRSIRNHCNCAICNAQGLIAQEKVELNVLDEPECILKHIPVLSKYQFSHYYMLSGITFTC